MPRSRFKKTKPVIAATPMIQGNNSGYPMLLTVDRKQIKAGGYIVGRVTPTRITVYCPSSGEDPPFSVLYATREEAEKALGDLRAPSRMREGFKLPKKLQIYRLPGIS